jgi:large subunit ribosomal protein L29
VTKQAQRLAALRAMAPDELAEHMREQRRRLFEVRFQQATGQVEDHQQISRLRREIAQAMTVQIEARHAAERGELPVHEGWTEA